MRYTLTILAALLLLPLTIQAETQADASVKRLTEALDRDLERVFVRMDGMLTHSLAQVPEAQADEIRTRMAEVIRQRRAVQFRRVPDQRLHPRHVRRPTQRAFDLVLFPHARHGTEPGSVCPALDVGIGQS